MRRLPRVTGIALPLALLLLALPAQAQEPVRFGAMTATSHFPSEILFSVVVEGQANIEKLELSYRVSGSPYTQSRFPDFAPGRRVETTFYLDTQVEFYPPGTEFHYYWTATDANGYTAESAEQTLVYEDDRFDWQQLRTDRVAVYWYRGDQSFGQRVLDTATRALARLEEDTGAQVRQQVRIYLYGTEEDFRGALGPNSPEWIGGQANPPLSSIIAYIPPYAQEYGEIERLIPHEISHVVLYQVTHNPYADNPTWLEEGIAVHNQEVADEAYPLLVEDAAREGTLIPLRALSASFPSDPDLASLSYAESSSIIEFILDRYGPEGLSALVQVFAEGETAEAAVQRALGVSLEELEAAWKATLPAAERTPIPAETAAALGTRAPARTRTSEGGGAGRVGPEGWLYLLASALALTFFLALLVITAALVILVRRQRERDKEQGK